jgi:hypothetical protein
MSKDIVTSFITRAADVLFVQNPKGTSIGAFSGVAADGALKLFGPALLRWKEYIAPERINTFYLVALGIVLFNMRSLFRRRQLPDEIENAIVAIRTARQEGKITDVQARMAWLALCNSVVERVTLDPAKQKAVRDAP